MFGLFKKPTSDLTDLDAAVRCFRKRRFDEALRRADAIIESAPEVALSHRFRGEVLFAMERYADCEESFRQAEKLAGPRTEERFFWHALAAANGGDPKRGVRILEEYIASPNATPGMVAKCRAAIRDLQTA